MDELLVDFPFVEGEAERAHAVGLLLLPFVRELIEGPTPLHLIEKPMAGTGATLMVDMMQFIFTGRRAEGMTEGKDDDEWRKRITAKLLTGTSYILIDNLQRRFDSAAVSSAITATTWEDRRLGLSEMARISVRCAWIATGNNPVLSAEIARRTVRIRLDAKEDRPWLRTGFHHENLPAWVAGHRGDLIWSALVLIRAWVMAGRPCPTMRLGMFEGWSGVIGGILKTAGIQGFLGNLEDFYTTTDTDSAGWLALVNLWWETFTEKEVGVSDLWPLVMPTDGEAIDLDLGDGKTEKSQKTSFGKRLVQMRDRQFESHRIVMGGKRKGAQLWKLVSAG